MIVRKNIFSGLTTVAMSFTIAIAAIASFSPKASAAYASFSMGSASAASWTEKSIRGRDIVDLAKDDIDTFRTTGETSEFLQQVVARLAKMNQISEAAVYLELKK